MLNSRPLFLVVLSLLSRLALFLLLVGWIAPATIMAEADVRFPVEVDEGAGEFCLIVVPDTQRYAAYFPQIFRKQFQTR